MSVIVVNPDKITMIPLTRWRKLCKLIYIRLLLGKFLNEKKRNLYLKAFKHTYIDRLYFDYINYSIYRL